VTVERLFSEARRTGLDEASYREELRRQLLQTKLINVRLQGRIRVSDDDLKTGIRSCLGGARQARLQVAWVLVSAAPGLKPAENRRPRALASA